MHEGNGRDGAGARVFRRQARQRAGEEGVAIQCEEVAFDARPVRGVAKRARSPERGLFRHHPDVKPGRRAGFGKVLDLACQVAGAEHHPGRAGADQVGQ